MITVFFNEDGYCVTGEGVEVSRRCFPARTDSGELIFQPLHHSYKVLYLALCEVRDMAVKEDVMIYNDSRIIDEILRNVEPIDSTCAEWLKTIQRHTIPAIKSVVFFRKKSTAQVAGTISATHGRALVQLDPRTKEQIANAESKAASARELSRKGRLLQRLKQSWFKDNNGK